MTLFQLRIFSMATRMSFQKVAEELYISPPSVTKYISSLESELQRPLFIRNRNKVVLSEFGREFLPYADDILDKEDSALEFVGTRTKQQQTIAIGVDYLLRSERWDRFYLSLIRARNSFREQRQGWNVSYRFLNFAEMRVNLNEGKTDFSLIEINNSEMPATLAPSFHYKEIFRHNYLLAIPSSMKTKHTLAGDLTEDIEKVGTLMFVNDPASKKLAIDFNAESQIKSKLTPLSHWGEVLMKMASGDGAALLAEEYRDAAIMAGGLIYPLLSERLSTSIYAIWRNQHENKIAQEFISILHQEFSNNRDKTFYSTEISL